MTTRAVAMQEICDSFRCIEPELDDYRELKRWAVSYREAALHVAEYGLLEVEWLVETYADPASPSHHVYLVEEAVAWWEAQHPGARPS